MLIDSYSLVMYIVYINFKLKLFKKLTIIFYFIIIIIIYLIIVLIIMNALTYCACADIHNMRDKQRR